MVGWCLLRLFLKIEIFFQLPDPLHLSTHPTSLFYSPPSFLNNDPPHRKLMSHEKRAYNDNRRPSYVDGHTFLKLGVYVKPVPSSLR